MSTIDRRFILLTGAAGRIGTAFRQAHGERYRFRLADLRSEGLAETPGEATRSFRSTSPMQRRARGRAPGSIR